MHATAIGRYMVLSVTAMLLGLLAGTSAQSRQIHVSPRGSDASGGTEARPYQTIQSAATVARPGDEIVIHGGTYREWVRPRRGGSGGDQRIVYRAAPGEEVLVKGSERITSWQAIGDGVWRAKIPNAFFGDYNPFALNVSGGWLNYGQWHTRGDVYLDGEALLEKETLAEVNATEHCWHADVDDRWTAITAHFGAVDPNEALCEINVRECIFMPQVSGLAYITIDGLKFAHAAANWAPPSLELQTGAVGTRMGKRWIIENCTVTNARCVGIILGHAPGVDYEDIDAYGDHIVRNNVIRRCGQAGIAGQKGATRSLIAGNVIEETNYRREFGGWETAAVKFHNSVDTVVSGNLIRGVYHQMQGAFGIWMDYGNQGTRITGNVIYNTQEAPVFLEMNHGPTLVDNNVLVGQDVRSNSEATVFAHNLLVDCGYVYRTDIRRRSQYYRPHTTIEAGRKTGTAAEECWFDNLFVRKGLGDVEAGPGHRADGNAFLDGAQPSSFGDQNSLVSSDQVTVQIDDRADGATVAFSVPAEVVEMAGPRVDVDLVGRFSTSGQTLENRDGNPISVDRDIRGEPFLSDVPGPLADLKAGRNTITWTLHRPEQSE